MASPTSPSRLRALTAVALLAPLALVACGGDDDDAADDVTTVPGAESGDVSTRVTAADREGDVEPVTTATSDTVADPATTSGDDTDDSGDAGDSGDSGEGADRDEWIATGADYLNGGDRDFDECLAAAVIDGFGHDDLEASGATPEEFWSASDIEQFGLQIDNLDDVAGNLTDCGDLVDYFAVASGGTDEQIDCMREYFSDDDVAAVIVSVMTGVEPTDDLLDKQADVQACAQGAGATE